MSAVQEVGVATLTLALLTGSAWAQINTTDLDKLAEALKAASRQGATSRPNNIDGPGATASRSATTPTPRTNAELVVFIDMTAKGASEAEIADALEKMRGRSGGKSIGDEQ